MISEELLHVVSHYGLDVVSIQEIYIGHINQTYKLSTSNGNYILQKINSAVFEHIDRIIYNESLLRKYLSESENPDFLVPLIQTNEGENFFTTNGEFWRVTKFMDDLYSPLFIGNHRTAYSLGQKIREFHYLTRNIDVHNFKEVIPDFHNLDFRFSQYLKALETTTKDLDSYNFIFDEIDKFIWLSEKYRAWIKTGDCNKILCHNDTKISNTLVNPNSGIVEYLIDLDTLMPEYDFIDIGDAVRAGCSMSDESELDENKVCFDIKLFNSIIEGYFGIKKDEIDSNKLDVMVKGSMMMLYMQSLRFMTDYLNGDKYYKINFEGQNAIRARNQLILLRQLNDYSLSKI